MQKKVTYIVSDIDKALSFEWITTHIDKQKIELSFILLNSKKDTPLFNFLLKKQIKTYYVPCSGKKNYIKAIYKTSKILNFLNTDVIHTHFLDANIIGLAAGKISSIKKRIHTRHHSSFHHVYFPRAVYYDKLVNLLSTDIIAITDKVKDILVNWEQVPNNKIHLIHHGFDLGLFQNPDPIIIKEVRKRHKIPVSGLVFGVIARYTPWKGIQYIIPAFKEILRKNPTAHLILANAKGSYKQEIKQLLSELPNESYTEITFEPEINSLYHIFDFYIHTPIDDHSEAFGQTYIEALASKTPSIFSLSGIANSFIKHNDNALVVQHKDTNDLINKINTLISNSELQIKLKENGSKSVESFSLAPFIKSLEKLYLN